MTDNSSEVLVYVYNLESWGSLSSSSTSSSQNATRLNRGERAEGAYHTSVVVFGSEYSFDKNKGITITPAKEKIPLKTEHIGDALRSKEDLDTFVASLKAGSFKKSKYDFLFNNCQTFSDSLCMFLCDKELPSYIKSFTKYCQAAVHVATLGGFGALAAVHVATLGGFGALALFLIDLLK